MKRCRKDSYEVFYGTRFARFDLLWLIGDLAREISKWIKACDRRLYRLMGHLQTILDHGLKGFRGYFAKIAEFLHIVTQALQTNWLHQRVLLDIS